MQRTLRLALGLDWARGAFHLTGDGGVHLVSNDGFVPGASKTRLVGRLGMQILFRGESPLP